MSEPTVRTNNGFNGEYAGRITIEETNGGRGAGWVNGQVVDFLSGHALTIRDADTGEHLTGVISLHLWIDSVSDPVLVDLTEVIDADGKAPRYDPAAPKAPRVFRETYEDDGEIRSHTNTYLLAGYTHWRSRTEENDD